MVRSLGSTSRHPPASKTVQLALPRLQNSIVAEAILATVVAATLAAMLSWLGPPGSDLAAHVYQSSFFHDRGFALWNNFW